MALLNPRVVTRTGGGAKAMVAANAGGDTFTPGDDVFLHAITTGTGSTVTVATPGNVRGILLAGQAKVLAATDDQEWGPFPSSLFAGSGGVAAISYTSVTGLTIEVKRHPTS